MGKGLVPSKWYRSIYEIDLDRLAQEGITLLLADLDNTLIPYGEKLPGEAVRQWEAELRRRGIRLFILSNSRKPNRAGTFAQALGVPFQGRSGKPRRGGFDRAMERMGAAPDQTAIVGDQIFTDIWGGNRAGVTTLLVDPIARDNLFRRLRYWVETPFRCRADRGAGCHES